MHGNVQGAKYSQIVGGRNGNVNQETVVRWWVSLRPQHLDSRVCGNAEFPICFQPRAAVMPAKERHAGGIKPGWGIQLIEQQMARSEKRTYPAEAAGAALCPTQRCS
jgi:hypothetical protein